MYKTILTILLIIGLTGCEKSYSDKTDLLKLPPELEHCKLYHMKNGIRKMWVMHCPAAEATTIQYKQGKETKHAVLVQDKACKE